MFGVLAVILGAMDMLCRCDGECLLFVALQAWVKLVHETWSVLLNITCFSSKIFPGSAEARSLTENQ